MFSSTLIAGLLLGLSHMPSSVAQPVNASSFIITHVASDHFPHAKGDLSRFDVDVKYVGYDANTQSWLTSLDPASGSSDEEKAKIMTAAAYAKPFDSNDPDMNEDVNSLLASIAGNTTGLQKRGDGAWFQVSTDHAVEWAFCANILSCVSGTTCMFGLDIGNAPRSQCSVQGGQNCCISWSNYNVRASFFQSTFTACNEEIDEASLSSVSCEGHGGLVQGGDICLSNRANGCT